MKRKSLLLLAVFCLTLVNKAPAQSFREEGLRIGPKELEEFVSLRVGEASWLAAAMSQRFQYDSNIFLDSNNKKHDLISVTTPRILWNKTIGHEERHLFQLLYQADAATYSNYKSQNYVNQNLAANLNLQLPFGYWNIQNGFKDTQDRADSEFTSQIRRRSDLAQTRLGIAGNKLSYELAYGHYLQDYYERQYNRLNYTDDLFGLTAFYQLMPQTQALIEYGHGIVNYSKDETRDGLYDQISLGLKGNILTKTEGLVKLGYQKRDYDAASRSDYEGMITQAGFITNLSERTKLDVNYTSNAVESISSVNNYYKLNLLSLNFTQRLAGNFSVIFLTSYEHRAYPEAEPAFDLKERDKLMTIGTTLRYDVKTWGRVNLGYQYKELDSNIDEKEYNDNLVTLRFDLLM